MTNFSLKIPSIWGLHKKIKIIPKHVWIGDFYPLKDQADHRSNNLCYLNFGWLDKKNVTTDKKLATQRRYEVAKKILGAKNLPVETGKLETVWCWGETGSGLDTVVSGKLVVSTKKLLKRLHWGE